MRLANCASVAGTCARRAHNTCTTSGQLTLLSLMPNGPPLQARVRRRAPTASVAVFARLDVPPQLPLGSFPTARFFKVGPREIHTPNVRASRVGERQAGIAKRRVVEVGPAEVTAPQIQRLAGRGAPV